MSTDSSRRETYPLVKHGGGYDQFYMGVKSLVDRKIHKEYLEIEQRASLVPAAAVIPAL